MSRFGLLLLLAASCACPGFSNTQWPLMPMPASVVQGEGRLSVPDHFGVALEGYTEPRLERAVVRIGGSVTSEAPVLVVRTAGPSEAIQRLGEDESYTLTVTAQQAVITAANPLGALHGLQTFIQLVSGGSTPAVTIQDKPRFPWRGLHLDVARHFMPLDVIRRNLDGMAAVKLNVFHWHLSDDQGFRVESKLFPKLQGMGSDGLFYTQDQIREIVEYAHDRGIRVVPEFDIPGHATSWLVGYPELGAAPGPYEIIRKWGVFDPAMNPANPAVYAFLDSFIGEMAGLFPDAYLHIGGDEVKRKDLQALQPDFNVRIEQILTKYGKKMEGWDEILNPAIPKNIVIQSWRGTKSLSDAARQGYQGILSSGYYLDHIEPASKLYLVDPLGNEADSLSAEEKQRILGGEVCMWAEYVSPETVDSRIWPRAAAIAERFWSPQDVRDVPDMYRRLAIVDRELDHLGLKQDANYLPMLERIAGSDARTVSALKVLADVTEPGTLGLRHRVNPDYLQSTPLNRFVDAVRPDPAEARRFSDAVDRYLEDRGDSEAKKEIRDSLQLWIDNDAKIPVRLRDAKPVSITLARISREGLSALGAIEKGRKLPRAAARQPQKPIGEVTLPVAIPIARLTAAAS